MSVDDTKRRREVMEEMVTLFSSSLARFDNAQLEAFLQQMRASEEIDIGIENSGSPNDAAVVMINPKASKEDTVAAVRQLAKWLEENWEEVRGGCEDGGVINGCMNKEKDLHLPN